MIVRSPAHHFVSQCIHFGSQSRSILQYLRLVFHKFRSRRLLEAGRQGPNGMVVWSSLQTRKDGKVDFIFQIIHDWIAFLVGTPLSLAIKDHGTPWTPQALVCGSRDYIGIGETRRNHFCRHEPRDMCHIRQNVGTDTVGNFTNTFVINKARIGRRTGNNQLGTKEFRRFGHLIVINNTSGFIETVGHGFKVTRNHGNLFVGCLITMRQVTSMR
mmetsp:Transcript_9007/g.11987  ORF Transcript_9007/g.11987 Transcript_9007/m.11987 type:complete len:214 (+) Transcript_9007:569-1210(+)